MGFQCLLQAIYKQSDHQIGQVAGHRFHLVPKRHPAHRKLRDERGTATINQDYRSKG
jgi:hypothetical protein